MHLQDDPVSSQAREKTFRKCSIFALPLLLGLVLLLAMSVTTSLHSDSLFDRSLLFLGKGGSTDASPTMAPNTALDVLEAENAVLVALNAVLVANVAALEMMLNNSVSMDAATQMQIDVMVENFARNGKSCFRVWTDLFVDMLEYKTCCSRPH
jgi:hypothetical protein